MARLSTAELVEMFGDSLTWDEPEPNGTRAAASLTTSAPRQAVLGASSDTDAIAARTTAAVPDESVFALVVGLLRRSPTYRQAAPDVEVLLSLAAGTQVTYSDKTVALSQRARDLVSRVAIEAGVRRTVLSEGTFNAVEVGDLLASAGKNTRDKASRLRKKGDLLGLDVDGRVLYPVFQFDPTRAALREGVSTANQALKAAGDPWGVASWWLSPHGRLRGGRRPADLAIDGDTARLAALVAAAISQD